MFYTVGLVVGILLVFRLLWKKFYFISLRPPSGGYKHEVTLPHTEPLELYFADVSPTSMKVRMCLAAAGITFRPHVLKLPSVGSWDTKTPEYLRVNPGGTVPVLVHNGHPVYESNDQLLYIATKLMPTDSDPLLPSNEKSLNEYWISQTSWCDVELEADIETALAKRPGVYTFRLIPMLARLVKKGRNAILGHLLQLEDLLQSRGTKFIGGDHVVLADIAWATILDAMEFADWWEAVDSTTYPCVTVYWEDMKKLPSFKEARKSVGVDESVILDVQNKVREWKVKFSWFKDMYV